MTFVLIVIFVIIIRSSVCIWLHILLAWLFGSIEIQCKSIFLAKMQSSLFHAAKWYRGKVSWLPVGAPGVDATCFPRGDSNSSICSYPWHAIKKPGGQWDGVKWGRGKHNWSWRWQWSWGEYPNFANARGKHPNSLQSDACFSWCWESCPKENQNPNHLFGVVRRYAAFDGTLRD